MNKKYRLLFAPIMLMVSFFAIIQVPAAGEIDTSFNPLLANINGELVGSVVQPDGKIIIYGKFESVDNNAQPFVARLNPNGTFDPSFRPVLDQYGGNDVVLKIALQPDGKILVAGIFFYEGIRRGFIRLNPDGSSDTDFNNKTFIKTFLTSLDTAIFPDGRIIVVAATGQNWKTVLLNSQGDTLIEQNVFTRRFFIQPDGKILKFDNSPSPGTQTPISRYNQDFTADNSFSSSSSTYLDLDTQPDGKIIVGGSFFGLFGENIHKVARLNSNGTLDPTFNTANLLSMNGDVYKVNVLPDGKVLIAGSFTSINGTPAYKVARLNSNGSLDTSFSSTTSYLLEDTIKDLDLLPNGQIIATGRLVYRLNADGSSDFSFHTPLNGKSVATRDVVLQSDGKLIVVGDFTNANGNVVNKIVRINLNGVLDNSLSPGSINYGAANVAALQSDGKFLVGFGNRLVRYNPDGSLNLEFPNSSLSASAVAVAPNGNIYLGGLQYTLRSYNSSGTQIALQLSPNQPVIEVVAQSDSKVLFSHYVGPGETKYMRRINSDGATTDLSFVAPTLNGLVISIAVQPDGKILIGGAFTQVNGATRFYITRLNSDGSNDSSFTPNFIPGSVANVALQPDGKILVQYQQDDYSTGVSRPTSTIFRLNADGSKDNTFQKVTTNNSVTEMIVTDDNKAVIVGDFTRVNGIPKLGIARINLASAKTRFDFDGDGRGDVSVFRPSNGAWYIQQSQNGFTGVLFGFGTDKPVPADYDGDGKTDVAVFRPSDGAWYYLKSSDGTFVGLQWGLSTDIPLPGDFDGDGKADVNVFRPSDGGWYRLNSSTGAFVGVTFGQNGDQPLIADFDGDGKNDIAVFRPSTGAFYSLDSSTGTFRGVAFGFGTDIPTMGDYDGDGKTDVAVFRPSDGGWYRINSSTGAFFGILFGQNGDIPVAADYDGDGKADTAVFRSGNWYYLNSSNGAFVGQLFGFVTDKPIPSAFQQ